MKNIGHVWTGGQVEARGWRGSPGTGLGAERRGEDDRLVKAVPLLLLVGDWAEFHNNRV